MSNQSTSLAFQTEDLTPHNSEWGAEIDLSEVEGKCWR